MSCCGGNGENEPRTSENGRPIGPTANLRYLVISHQFHLVLVQGVNLTADL